ncbi:hypothetical protein Tco_0823574 [Tanacetum coccineum]|uniref:Uncharacterized protein n=1 Tax=Tanacetum coccineum TaxID=301880 RepID=A0ABQ5AI95_9ASTR
MKQKPKSPLQLIDKFVDEEVQGKGKEKVSDEQVALDLLTLQTPKKKSPTEQYIFQRRTSTPTESSSHDESSSLYVKLRLTVSEMESDEEVPGIVARVQDKGQAGPNPGEHDKGQARPNPGDAAMYQPLSSHVENLKLPTEGEVRIEDPTSSAGTLSSLQNINKELSFTNQFLAEKSQEDEPEKTNIEAEVQSMVTIPIHQDTLSVPLMTTPDIDLTISQPVPIVVQALLPTLTATATATTTTTTTTTTITLPLPPQLQQGSSYSFLIHRISELEQHMVDLVQANLDLEERIDKHGSRLYKLENLDIPHQVSKAVDEIVTDAIDWAIQVPLRDGFRDLSEADMKEILHHCMWESNSYKAHKDHKKLYEALEPSMARDHTDQLLTDLAKARKKKKKRHDSPKTPLGAFGSSQLPPPPPPLSTNQSNQSTSTATPSSSKTATSAEYTAWMTTDTRLNPFVSLIPKELHIDDDTTPDEQVQSSGNEDIGHDHIPIVNLRQNWWKPLTECRPATPEPAWSIPSSDLPVLVNNWASALASTYSPPSENSLLAQTSDMAIFMDWFCKKQGITELKQQDLEGPAYEIVKVFHPNVIHLQYQIEECHKLLTDQVDESIIRYTSKGDRIDVRTHMRILSVVRIKVFSLYGYDYMKKIVLRRADLKEYIITERDFKYLYPSDFEDLNLVTRQRIEDFQLGIESYQTQLNLTKPRWDATGFEFKHDFTVMDSPRAVTFRDKYGDQMIMWFNEIYKFSNGTLQQIDEALDYRVKEFKVNRMNLGLNTRFWTRKDVDRIKEFMFAIQKRLKTRRIFQNLESFVGGRIREGDYRLLKRTE